ncbi:hypothetical protein RUM43_003057 [Polyplax serrata]|uniref:Uncharacterized protein n=1 Tax=Polyplax serrata TaxID=468196 RepID=A0AAN8S2Z0_POLSC
MYEILRYSQKNDKEHLKGSLTEKQVQRARYTCKKRIRERIDNQERSLSESERERKQLEKIEKKIHEWENLRLRFSRLLRYTVELGPQITNLKTTGRIKLKRCNR